MKVMEDDFYDALRVERIVQSLDALLNIIEGAHLKWSDVDDELHTRQTLCAFLDSDSH